LRPLRTELSAALGTLTTRIEGALDRALPATATAPPRLSAAMRYAVLGGGKRIRPLLAYAACIACDGRAMQADASAVAVELIHAYSLIHDDLPAMDDDDLRRGRATVHIAFDEASAILAGDALLALAFEILAADTQAAVTATVHLQMLRRLAEACGPQGMAGGQALDLAAVGTQPDLAALELMHERKTGALIRAATALGALSAHADDAAQIAALDRYAHHVGLAFQIRDDILDVEGESSVIGKRSGADAARDKPTYVSALGLDQARARLEGERQAAHVALTGFDPGPERCALLAEIADYAADRLA